MNEWPEGDHVVLPEGVLSWLNRDVGDRDLVKGGNMASSTKLAANRENARRSTGPRSPDGKAVSSRNALKHGLLAREVLLASEDARDLEDLEQRLRAVLRPADDLEELLVDRVVSCAWRLRRALQAEAAEVERAQAAALRPVEDDVLALVPGESRESLVRFQRGALRGLDETVSWLGGGGDPFELYEDEDDDPLADTYLTLAEQQFPKLIHEEDEQPARKVRQHIRGLGWSVEQAREILLAILRERAREMRRRLRQHSPGRRDSRRLALRACAVPGDGNGSPLDRLLRYENAIERSLFRALHELHRLQAVRAGAAVLPPVVLDVTGSE
jgi:hypothetical protein